MFELFKKRELGDYIVDTFTFFKSYGKHFFKTFFLINAGMLLVVGALVYWFLKHNFQSLVRNNLDQTEPDSLLNYFNDNDPALLGFIAISTLVILIVSLFNASYPVLYLKLIAAKNTNNFTTNDILSSFKQSIWKLFKFTIGVIFIIFPVLFITIIILFFLCFVLIGIPLLILAIPTLFTWIHLSFYIYLTQEKSFFQSLNNAYLLLKANYWNSIGVTFIAMVIIQMVQGSITMFIYFVGIFLVIGTALVNPNFDNQSFDAASPVLLLGITLIFLLILVISTIFNNMLVINQGIIYYGLQAENKISAIEIDLIGNNNE